MNILAWFSCAPPTPQETASWMIIRVARSAFRVFHNRSFRALLHFESLKQIEQDRIFNELIVSGLGLVLCMGDTAARMADGTRQEFLKAVGTQLPSLYGTYLRKLGIEEQHLATWEQLITMRRDEYEQDRLRYREHLPEPTEGNPWILVITNACLYHIRRGTPLPHDPLFKDHLLPWMYTLALAIEKKLIHNLRRIRI